MGVVVVKKEVDFVSNYHPRVFWCDPFRHLPFNVAVFQPKRTGNAFLGCIVYFYLSSLCNRTHYTWYGNILVAFGQFVILLLIQIGGMGVITIAASFAMISGRKISLMQRSTMQERISAPKVGGIVRLTGFIVRVTLVMELLCAAVMRRCLPWFREKGTLDGTVSFRVRFL